MRSRLTVVLVFIAMLLASCTAAFSQTATGQFNGHVTDQNGAVVPGATVTLQDVGTSLNRNTQTNGEGLYQFPLVQPGVYKISVTQTGFETATSAELKLDVNQISSQDFKLEVGATSQTVTVSSAAELLQASTANLGAVVETRPVADLPLNGRSFSALLTLAPWCQPGQLFAKQRSWLRHGLWLGRHPRVDLYLPIHARPVESRESLLPRWHH